MRSSTYKTQFVCFTVLVSALFFLYAFCGNSSAQDFKTLHPGVEYAHVDQKLGNDPVKINLLRLDLTKVRLDVHHAFEKALGVEPTSEIAKRNNAIAAINGGFFRKDETEFSGDAAGVLTIDNILISEPTLGRIALQIRNGNKFTEIAMQHLRFGGNIWWRHEELEEVVKGINRERKSGEVIVYTPEFGKNTKTDSSGLEVIIRGKRIVAISANNSAIPKDGWVLSASDGAASLLRKMKVGDLLRPAWSEISDGRPNMSGPPEDITNGVSQLLMNGKIDITWEREKASKSFAEMRHPRTAVAKLKDGKFLMITVDGRQPGVSIGMNLQELAEYLLSIGATDAMNLDGGGSTTMFLDGKVVNTPSDKEGERKVSDAIVVTLRKKVR
ncbi:MAG: hypothetical protein DMF63_14500 [Acidobacteria bacterium]|nr:MAG: hypothetical protein DMF63_14500 [Acidobacteriota bacterium]